LRSDGAVVAWGDNTLGQLSVPPLPLGQSYVKVVAGYGHSIAQRSDGVWVAWGDNSYGQSNLPVLPAGLQFLEMSAGWKHTVGLVSDGTILAWGDNAFGKLNVPALSSGQYYVQVDAGAEFSTALLNDGSIVGWGQNYYGQTSAPSLPPGTNVIRVVSCYDCTLAICGPSSLAQVNPYGLGCIGIGGATRLSSSQVPTLGNASFSLDVTLSVPNVPAYLFLASAPAQIQLPSTTGCFIYLDLPSLQQFISAGVSPLGPTTTNALGTASFTLPVPANASLAGVSIYCQAAVLDWSTLWGLSLSNGVQCLIN
jgi:hypothetical protein